MKTFRILLILLWGLRVCGQQLDVLSEADEHFKNKRYATAFSLYSSFLKKEPDNAAINYKVGICYLNSRSLKHKAVQYFEKALEKGVPMAEKVNGKEPDITYSIYKYLGDAYCINYQFDAAISSYKKYKEFLAANKISDPVLAESIERKIEMCKFGKDLKELVALPVNIKQQKKTKNSKASFDSSSALSSDKTSRIFTYKVPLQQIRKYDDLKYYEETEIVKTDSVPSTAKKTKPIKPSNGREPDTAIYVTTIGTSVDGQVVLSYRNDNGDGNLFITSLRSNQWSSIVRLNKTINTSGWEPNETISPDGKTLYFATDRPGGYGGMDIYYCTKQSDGEWSKAVNLGPMVNSPYNDVAPFIHPDGVTLYFSSNRNNPTEYYDNFTTNLTSAGNWSKPVAVGYPIDKGSDNVFYQVAADKKKIYTPPVQATKQMKQKYADSIREMNERENYIISFVTSKKVPLTLLKGKVTDKTGSIPGRTEITVTDNATGEIEGVYYSDNMGHYSLILPAGKNNNITF
ncbi:MAG: hypothetical protein K0S12_1784, partial [Bacteroidetes bacterium]|nr:hypothetical protein [Bacteroidota bacterium]